MNTFGLNRHLNSFGLSYPGYWFIVLVDDDGHPLRTFIAYGDWDYTTSAITTVLEVHANHTVEYIPTAELRDLILDGRADYIAYRIPDEVDADGC